jgi:signal transduction histidine kinase
VPHALAYAAAGTIGLGLAAGTALLALTVLGFGTRLAMTVGLRAGREAERATLLRGMHDTVLQTLEAIALQPLDSGDPEQTLRRLRGMARGEALQIRRALDDLAGEPTSAPQLADDLAALAGELAGSGLRVQLALGLVTDSALPASRRAALRDATREALCNAAKHSGAQSAVLRLDEADGGVCVVVRDHGRGFDERARTTGFGIRQSIRERMVEAGGHAEVWSRPGRGTRVTLWAPLREPARPD